MKKAILFIVVFVLGAVSYSLLTSFFTGSSQETATTTAIVNTEQEAVEATPKEEEEEPQVPEDTTSLAADGSLLDGPFALVDAQGKQTNATVQIVRSPEETLLQFDDFELEHSSDSRIYFSKDLEAGSHFNLAPAQMEKGVLIYGIPLDVDLGTYKYILIYDEQMDELEYSAKIQ